MTRPTIPSTGRPGAVVRAMFVLGMVALLPSTARACDPNCPTTLAVLVGVPSAGATSLLAPLVARAVSGRTDVPYWSTVGIAAAASTAGVLWARSGVDRLTITGGDITRMIAAPVAAGVLATAIVHRSWPRRDARADARPDASRDAPMRRAPSWMPAVLPDRGGGVLLAWRFDGVARGPVR